MLSSDGNACVLGVGAGGYAKAGGSAAGGAPPAPGAAKSSVHKKSKPQVEQWWNPSTWSASTRDTWQNIGAVAAGIAVAAAAVAVVVAASACTVATFGVCGVVLLAGFAVAGGLGAAVTYDLSTGPKSTQGELQAIGLGAAGGAVGGLAGPVVGEVASAIGSKGATGVTSNVEAQAASRAAQLQGQLSAGSQGRVTMGVGIGQDSTGALRTVIGTSEPGGYLRPGVRAAIQSGEEIARGPGHAEQSILAHMRANDVTPITIGAGRPICPICASEIANSGASAATGLRQ